MGLSYSVTRFCFCCNERTSIPAWIINYVLDKMSDEITYPFPNFSGCTVVYVCLGEMGHDWLRQLFGAELLSNLGWFTISKISWLNENSAINYVLKNAFIFCGEVTFLFLINGAETLWAQLPYHCQDYCLSSIIMLKVVNLMVTLNEKETLTNPLFTISCDVVAGALQCLLMILLEF